MAQEQSSAGQLTGVDIVPFPFGEVFDELNLDSLRNPLARVGIPDLQDALAAIDAGNSDLLMSRLLLMPRAHLDPNFLLSAYALSRNEGIPFMIVSHEPSLSAGETAEALTVKKDEICDSFGIKDLPQVLKSVTIAFQGNEGRQVIILSGVGDFSVSKDLKKELGAELGISNKKAKEAIVNPKDFDVALILGLHPGLVKPILKPFSAGNVSGIGYLKGQSDPEDFVAISVSHLDSMILRVSDFERLFTQHAEENYMGFSLNTKPDYVFYSNQRSF